MDTIFTDVDERRAIVDDVAARIGVASWVVEKDLWVCWTLARLQEIEGLPELTFKGGTSLSKGASARRAVLRGHRPHLLPRRLGLRR